jgi:hypothetical protein
MAGMALGIDLDLSRGPERDPLEVSNEEVEATVAHLNAEFAAGRITHEQMTASLRNLLGADSS